MTVAQSRFGYAIDSRTEEGQRVAYAVLACAKCGDRAEKRMHRGHLPPDVVAKFFKRDGWALDPMKAHTVRCPSCQHPKEPKLTKETKVALAVVPAAVTPAPPEPKITVTGLILTPAQKILVRRKLDALFDEPKGIYLDGYTDQKIGEEIGLPWLAVRELREAAYGPLRSMPELDALVAQHQALMARTEQAVKDAAAIQKDAAALACSIQKLAAKFGIRTE